MRVVAIGFIAALSLFFVFGSGGAQEKKDEPQKDGPKFTIKEVMKNAYRNKKPSSLVQKVIQGEADETERKQLVEYNTALAKNTPRRGDAEAWKKRTGELLDAARKNDVAALKKAANCNSCHDAFKK